MKTTGVTRRIDALGRIVLPMEIRQAFGINSNEPLEIFLDKSSIVLKKYNPGCTLCDNTENLISFKDKKFCMDCISQLAEKAGYGSTKTKDGRQKNAYKRHDGIEIFSKKESAKSQPETDNDYPDDDMILETGINSLVEDFSSYVENYKEDEEVHKIDGFEKDNQLEDDEKSEVQDKPNIEASDQNMRMEQYERELEYLREQLKNLKEKQERGSFWRRLFGSGHEEVNKSEN
ncbi:AbrB/MazE/SpoVT family DNA-binding domain-containing protein [Acetivibrio clariflavus]|mgnify:FL=1|uniref:Looped-hinge helix DNA binding domain, AbrB family n=1 Tax=Acetivibrio clariflavus (strain DSM 19732 / NBRC 101661 / EBR45) TaxID=720554 RepID=G8LZI5_ACECE|nr:AbrB/MazE/SpoVT family DNA-binding domain-containing protein [Acetivibrio clariflavus]AEV66848.1 looped-hinge helix DNA binding domain, AbrB family [Acetivibrio clariflavus DSM 19732]